MAVRHIIRTFHLMNQRPAIVAIIIACLFCIAWTIARTPRKPKCYEVTGTITLTHDYCGGAKPTEEQINPRPYSVKGTTLYIRRSSDNKIVDSAVTDSAGNFKVQLVAGKYCFVEKWKTETLVIPANSKYETWDTACYRKQYNTCEYSLDLKQKTSGVNIILRRHCAWTRPCCSYRGPMPPSAPPVNRSGNQPGHQE